MAVHLEAIDSKVSSRPITVIAGRPRVFKIVKHGHDAGNVTVEMLDNQCIVTNRSERPVLINGTELTRSMLVHGDTVVIGKESFRVVDDTPSEEDIIEPVDLNRVSGYQPTPSLQRRSDTPSPPALAPRVHETAEAKESAESDRQRRRRSISASMNTPSEPPKATILNRVSSVFSSKTRNERQKEEELQKERHQLLEEAGRQVLAGHALGIPDGVFADLLAGRAVTVHPGEISRGALERWRELTQRVALLDAEIAALRRTLGLGQDLGAVRLTAPTARSLLKEREDRVFATLDALATQDLSGQSDPGTEPTAAVEPAASASNVSGRSRVSGRRRHH